MLRELKELVGRTVVARDGDIGEVKDVYFDDEAWGVRYLVTDIGSWTAEGRVLISPYSVEDAELASGVVRVDLTRQQVKDSPGIDTHKPVSRQHEAEYLRYYGFPMYWGGPNLWGMDMYPVPGFGGGASAIPADVREQLAKYGDKPPGDAHLRCMSVVERYHIEAADGSMGHVCGFIFDDEAWVIRYLEVDTRNLWSGGKKVLLATQWIDLIDWYGSSISTPLTREAIGNSPEYDESIRIDRLYETRLHDFYQRNGYWASDDKGHAMQVAHAL
jgi:hypothetical protein